MRTPATRNQVNWWGAVLTVLLCTLIGIGSALLANGNTTQDVHAAVPAAGAPAATTHTAPPSAPAKSSKPPAVYTGNPFKALPTTQDAFGNTVTTYACAAGLTQVDLPVGKPYSVGGTKIMLTEDASDGYQNDVKVSIALGPYTGLAGMIIHAAAGSNDTIWNGKESDTTYATRLTGGSSTIPLSTSSYTQEAVGGDTITGVSFCFNLNYN